MKETNKKIHKLKNSNEKSWWPSFILGISIIGVIYSLLIIINVPVGSAFAITAVFSLPGVPLIMFYTMEEVEQK